MAGLIATDYSATITWLGLVPHRDALEIVGLPRDELSLTMAGQEGEFHAGLTRPSCSRVAALYERGTEIRNTRQLSIVSVEELAAIAVALELEALDPAWLGASIVVSGLDDFSNLPPASRLQGEAGCTLTVDTQNGPCTLTARTIERARPGHGKAFKAAAAGRRGVTAWVEHPGRLVPGERLRLFIPDQRPWAP